MLGLLRHRSTAIWAGLVAATLLSWWLSGDHAVDGTTGRRVSTLAILVVALVKVRFVALDFMELRGAPRVLRGLVHGWLALVLVSLTTIYLVA